jgi:hypothetical protein
MRELKLTRRGLERHRERLIRAEKKQLRGGTSKGKESNSSCTKSKRGAT